MFQSLKKNLAVKAFLCIKKKKKPKKPKQVKKHNVSLSMASLLSRKKQQQYTENFFLNLFPSLKAVYIKIIVLL